MVGVLAVPAPLEDYTVQPCKKQRKEEDPPSKTITNYFSPLSKTIDKGLSSPKSSNIADYFIRSPSAPSKERTPSYKTSSPIYGAKHRESPTTPTGYSKPRRARQGKRTKLIKRLADAATPAGGRANCVTVGSDTAALLAEICSHTADLEEEEDVVFQSETSAAGVTTNPQRGPKLKRRTRGKSSTTEPPTQQQSGTSNISLVEESSLEGKEEEDVVFQSETSAAGVTTNPQRGPKLKRRTRGKSSTAEPPTLQQSGTSNVSLVEDSSLEGPADGASDNLATLTVSFEDFMKSQGGKEQSEPSADPPDVTSAAGGDPEQLPSPKTVTVQAQVHLSPPLPSQNTKKIASIFKKNKSDKKKADVMAPECDQVGPGVPKRKSNVVIQEEDLELAVIHVETGEPLKPKSTPAERQQFMKAFQQVGEASKPNAKKTPARRKALKEGTESSHKPDAEEQPPGKAVTEEAMDKVQKSKRKNRLPPSTPTLQTPKSAEESPPGHRSPVLRRSLRRQESNPSSKSPDSPIQMSTPKSPCRKSDVYKSEVLTVPSDVESPIRMRFTRVMRRSNRRPLGSNSDEVTPGCKKIFQSGKKISKAKQLLEKAKVIQQNMAKAETPRRSARQKSRVPQELAVIADTNSSQKKPQKTPNLRSLNDVLGKKVKRKSLQSGQKKDVKKKVDKDGVIAIEDSSDGSVNSQDGEQFKARREFLRSGLPDSLKRQIARTSALVELYSASGSSFQTVVHVQQRDGCDMWSLPMPRCRLLTDLLPLCRHVPDVTRLTLSHGDFTRVNSRSAVRPPPALVSKRAAFSNIMRERLLEEIRCHNLQFPVRRFFKQFLKKQSDYLSLPDGSQSATTQQTEKCVRAAGGVTSADESAVQETGNRSKRKRKDYPCTKSKRKKPAACSRAEGEAQCDSAATTKELLSRSAPKKNSKTCEEPDLVIIEEERPTPGAEDAAGEDVLWTEKYQPQNSSELIGNSAAIRRLHGWLKDWKIRAEKEEKRNQMQKTGKDDTWDAGDFHDTEDSDEDSPCNTLLISGPPGVGKTAAVYACAQELGFKVFEVNASCQRSGRQILAQLREATQSHQVDQQGVSAHKPSFFSSSASGRSPRKLNSPKTVVSSPRKPPVSPRAPGHKKGLPPKSLTNFFIATPKQKPEVKKMNCELVRAPQSGSDGKDSRPDKGAEETQRKTATSLILFEEVDVIFEEDVGFLSAVKTFMSTTKRPVILTTSDPSFGMMFDGAFEEISFRLPSVVNVASFLQVLCLAENLRTDATDVMTFLTANKCDIRRSVLHLQFWARSGGGGLREKPLPSPGEQKTEARAAASCRYPASEISATDVPGCHVGCAENLLGVNSIISSTEGLMSFIKEKILEVAEWERILRLFTDFHTRNVHLTSSNLEFLLPLPVHVEAPEPASLPDGDTEDSCAVRSAALKRRQGLTLLDDSDLFDADSNSLDEVLSASTKASEENGPCSGDPRTEGSEVKATKRTLSPAERQASRLVCQCLDTMAEFAEHMSSLDCSTLDAADPAHTCSPPWTESRLKYGLCDGLRTDPRDVWGAQSCGEIRALIEALSFHKCSSKLLRTLNSSLTFCKRHGEDPTEELTLRVTAARGQVHFGQPAAISKVTEERVSVVRDVLSHRAFISLGSRPVNVTEYLPALRTICRLQKAKEEGKTKRRFLHYLEGIHLEFPKLTLSRLAEDFP